MKPHRAFQAARLLLELALALSGCQPVLATDVEAPPAMVCRMQPARAEAAGADAGSDAAEEDGAARPQPGIVRARLDCGFAGGADATAVQAADGAGAALPVASR